MLRYSYGAQMGLRWWGFDTFDMFVCASLLKNLEKCIPFDENGGVVFWALDFKKKAYNYISLYLMLKTVKILTLPLSWSQWICKKYRRTIGTTLDGCPKFSVEIKMKGSLHQCLFLHYIYQTEA